MITAKLKAFYFGSRWRQVAPLGYLHLKILRSYAQVLCSSSSIFFLPSSLTQSQALLTRHVAVIFLTVPYIPGSRSTWLTVQSTSTLIFQINFKTICPNKLIHAYIKWGSLSDRHRVCLVFSHHLYQFKFVIQKPRVLLDTSSVFPLSLFPTHHQICLILWLSFQFLLFNVSVTSKSFFCQSSDGF